MTAGTLPARTMGRHAENQTISVLTEVLEERRRQHERWGQQDLPDGTDWEWVLQRDLAQSAVEAAAKGGTLTYQQLLHEEVLEAYTETDPERLRSELLQVAAVAVQWIEKLDREKRGGR